MIRGYPDFTSVEKKDIPLSLPLGLRRQLLVLYFLVHHKHPLDVTYDAWEVPVDLLQPNIGGTALIISYFR